MESRDRTWLPGNVTWDDMKSRPDRPMPETHDLLFFLPMAILFLAFRLILEALVMAFSHLSRCLFGPMARFLGGARAEGSRRGKSGDGEPNHCSLRKRRPERDAQILKKTKETGARFVIYTSLFIYGIWAMYDKPWLWDPQACWVDFPLHSLSREVWWYYMLELGFYGSLILTLFTDVKRKDFLAQVVHHFVTVGLLSGSWIIGATRVGSLILVLHDAADVYLEGGKLSQYMGLSDKVSLTLFALLTVVWIATRVFVFPIYIIVPGVRMIYDWDAVRWEGNIMGPFLISLLWVLYGLHLYWTHHLLRAIYRALASKELPKDSRSDSEGSDAEADKTD